MELSLRRPAVWRVRRGQTLSDVARAFGVPPRLLAAVNALDCEPAGGQLLAVPPAGDLYTVRGGETKALLCGSAQRFEERNATRCLYPSQQVFL